MARGVLEAAVVAGLNAFVIWLNTGLGPEWLVQYNGVLVYLIRQVEGLVDQKIDPATNRVKATTIQKRKARKRAAVVKTTQKTAAEHHVEERPS